MSEAEEALCVRSPSASSPPASSCVSQRYAPRHDAIALHTVHSNEAEYAKDPNFKSDAAEREVEIRVRPTPPVVHHPVHCAHGRWEDSDSGARRMTLK